MEINFDFINELIKVVKNAYEQTKKMNNINIKNKEKNDIVTDIDIYMEKQIIYFIKQNFLITLFFQKKLVMMVIKVVNINGL